MSSTRIEQAFLLKELLEKAEKLCKVNDKEPEKKFDPEDTHEFLLREKLDRLSKDRDNQKLEDEIIDNLKYYINHKSLSRILITNFSYNVNSQSAEHLLKNPWELLPILYLNPSLFSKQDSDDNTLLHYIAKLNYHENLQPILDMLFHNSKVKIDSNLQNKNGNTVLHLFLYRAIEKGSYDKELAKYVETKAYDEQKSHWGISYDQLVVFDNKISKNFNYHLKNSRGISCAQLLLIYKLKFFFDIDILSSYVKTNNLKYLTKELFNDPFLNPIRILNNYKKTIESLKSEEKDSARITNFDKSILELNKLIGNLERLKERLFNPPSGFFNRLCHWMQGEPSHKIDRLKMR